MGVDIHLYICKYNPEDNLFHELCLYHKIEGNYEKVPIYDGRNYEMFDAIRNKNNIDNGYGIFPHSNLAINSLDSQLRKIVEQNISEIGVYGTSEITLSDLFIYINNHPTVVDYDADWEDWKVGDPKPQKTNPIKFLYEKCVQYTEFAEKYGVMEDSLSKYKILYWFDC